MHIPDGFLDAKTMAASAVLAAGGVGFALRQAGRNVPPRRVPLLGLAAAFVFAAQMLNFPVAGGTTGHLLGGVLAAVLVGPSAAVVVLAAVVMVQCFLFADGGVLALGANLFNMALLGPLGGYAIYAMMRRMIRGPRGLIFGAAFAGWCSVVLAAVSCAGQLALSGVVSWSLVFPAMANVHILIGVGEGLITALILTVVVRVRPDLIDAADLNQPVVNRAPQTGYVEFVIYGLVLALGLALFVSPFACSWPDGLEKVAQTLGFDHRAAAHPVLPAPLAEYQIPGLKSATWATAWAGAIGAVAAFGLAWLLAWWLVPLRPEKVEPPAPAPLNDSPPSA